MKYVKAVRGERLDKIVFREYGTLEKEVFNKVLEANPHLLKKLEFEASDIVYLPPVEDKKEDIGKTLW